jgi:hypothetical protein
MSVTTLRQRANYKTPDQRAQLAKLHLVETQINMLSSFESDNWFYMGPIVRASSSVFAACLVLFINNIIAGAASVSPVVPVIGMVVSLIAFGFASVMRHDEYRIVKKRYEDMNVNLLMDVSPTKPKTTVRRDVVTGVVPDTTPSTKTVNTEPSSDITRTKHD